MEFVGSKGISKVSPEVLLKLKVLQGLKCGIGGVEKSSKVCERGQNCMQNLVPA